MLKRKQKRFVEEYLIYLNATQAAIRAGYSVDTAYSIGAELLKKPEIKNAIERAIAERSRRTGITQERVLQELARIAFVDPTAVLDFSTGEVIASASSDDRAALASVKVKQGRGGTEREVKLQDKVKALELLGKHIGLFAERVQLEGNAVVQILDDIPASAERSPPDDST